MGLKPSIDVRCNICGEKINGVAPIADNHKIGYGSQYDGDTLLLYVCNSCLDKVIDAISPMCCVAPVLNRADISTQYRKHLGLRKIGI